MKSLKNKLPKKILMKFTLALFVVTVLAFSLSNCGKWGGNDPYLLIHPEIKKYFGAGEWGSWWEYEIVDSNRTSKVVIEGQRFSSIVNTKMQIIDARLMFANRTPIQVDGDQLGASVYIENSTYRHDFIFKNDSFVTYSYPGDKVFFLDSAEFNGHKFRDVLVSVRSGDLTEVWVAPNVGIIRMAFGSVQYNIKDYVIR